MSFDSSFDEKIDVIDFIINVLKDHEKKLEELVANLEGSSEPLSKRTKVEKISENLVSPTTPIKAAGAVAKLKKWSHFIGRCSGTDLVAFDVVDGKFKVSAIANGVYYVYSEEIPDMEIHYKKVEDKAHIESIDISSASLVPAALRGRLDCGLEFSKRNVEMDFPEESIHKVVYEIDPEVTRTWLAYQLGTNEESIVQGELLTY